MSLTVFRNIKQTEFRKKPSCKFKIWLKKDCQKVTTKRHQNRDCGRFWHHFAVDLLGIISILSLSLCIRIIRTGIIVKRIALFNFRSMPFFHFFYDFVINKCSISNAYLLIFFLQSSISHLFNTGTFFFCCLKVI